MMKSEAIADFENSSFWYFVMWKYPKAYPSEAFVKSLLSADASVALK